MPKSRFDARSRARAAGFTLIEVVVSLAVAGLGIAMLLAAAGTGLGNAKLANEYVEATRHAQYLLAGVGVAVPLVPGERSGQDGPRYSWRLRISDPVTHAAGASAMGPALYRVDISISWRSGAAARVVTLHSERLGPVRPHG